MNNLQVNGNNPNVVSRVPNPYLCSMEVWV